MQRDEFIQQLWLDYIHMHPDIGALRLWPLSSMPEYLTLVTLNHGSFAASALNSRLAHMGYRHVDHYAMADKGLLIHLLAPSDNGSWLILSELQLATLPKSPREALGALINQSHPQDCIGHNLLCRGRPWPMPSWLLYQQLQQANPLAAWIAIMGPRLHHAGFDCATLGSSLLSLNGQLTTSGMPRLEEPHNGVFSPSSLIEHYFYPTMPQKITFSEGDDHRLCLGGLALTEKHIEAGQERIAQLLMPAHARCEIA